MARPKRKRLEELFTPTSRSGLPPARGSGRKPHWRSIGRGRYLGFRPEAKNPKAGTWCVRLFVGDEDPEVRGPYVEGSLGEANGRSKADGEQILDYAQALKAAHAWCEDRVRRKEGLEPKDRKPYTVARAMADYLEFCRGHRKAPQQVEQVGRVHILPALGELEVGKLGTRRLRRWHQGIAETPPLRRTASGKPRNQGELSSPEDRRARRSTANRALAVLKAALNMAYREGKVESDDAWRRVKPFKGVDRPKIRYLEMDEAARLVNACEPDFRRIVRGALLTGCRYGELCRLRVGDFKATPMPLILLEDTKSGKSRHVYLNDEGAAFFEELTAGRTEREPMFVRSGGDSWGKSHQTRRMKDASEAAKLEPPATFHELRHTYASHYLMNGGDLYGLSQQLGHADTRMTTRHYAHLADRWRAEQARQHVPSFGSSGEEEAGRVIRFESGEAAGTASASS